jgi:4-hydroxy-2-oxoheptanedioate aldolase
VSEVRLNKVIEKLAAGEVVVSSPPVPNGSWEEAQTYGDSDFDMVIFEMEHFGFDFMALRTSLQAMLSRRRISDDGLRPSVVPTTRIPPNARETSQWIIKQCLDLGVYGFVAPQIQTPEDALAIVNAARYPAKRGSSLGGGERGYWPPVAARYWGVSQSEYVHKADVWPCNPDGELLIVGIVESRRGVENIERIVDATNGIGAIWPGPGDMASDMGLEVSNPIHPEVEENLAHVLEVCTSRNVPCVSIATSVEDALRRIDQGFQVIFTRLQPGMASAVREHAQQRSASAAATRQ